MVVKSRASIKLRTAPDRVKAIDTRRIQPPAKTADAFYTTTAWRHLVDRLKLERGNRCEDPNCRTQVSRRTRLFGDHINELRDGGAPLDPANVMLRCGACHSRKTAARRAERLAERV